MTQGSPRCGRTCCQDDLGPAFAGVDAVIHAAAAMSGDEARMQRDTVTATEKTMQAVAKAKVARVVLVSSLSVYGTGALRAGALVDEDTPLERCPALRDAYCRAKLAQEIAALDGARASGTDLCILRAGAVWGPGRLWNAHLGLALGPVLLRLGKDGQIPLIHVETCAEALVRAAEISAGRGRCHQPGGC